MTRNQLHRSMSALLLIATWLLSGCASPRPADAGPLGLSRAQPAGGALRADLLFPFSEGTVVYDIVAGDDVGGQFVFERSPASEHGSQWKQILYRVDPASDDRTRLRTEYWARNDNGDIVMPAVIDHGDRALTLFDPPILIAPAELNADSPVESESDMRVVDERNHRRQREAGNAVRTIELVERVRMQTEDGRRYDALRVRITFNADLKMADAEDEVNLFVAPEVGIVAQTRSDNVRILGAFNRSSQRTMLLQE